MSVIANNILAGAAGQGGAGALTLEKSVRFNDDDDAYLSKTFSSSGNRKTYTMSLWVKRGNLGKSYQSFLSNPDSNGYNGVYFNFSSDYLHLAEIGSSNWTWVWQSAAVYRDPNAWYHIVAAIDTTQAVAANRVKVYVNGVQVTDFYPGYPTYPSQNFDTNFNNNTFHAIGRLGSVASTNYHYDGYIADFYFIDGQQLDPTSFGAFDSSGVWQAAAYSGTFGTNGFHLFDFANESGIGNDSSGNDNDFTLNNLSNVVGNGNWISDTSATDYSTGSYGVAQMFDASLSTEMLAAAGTTSTFTPTGGLAFSSSFKIYAYDQNGGTIRFNWSGGYYDLTLPTANTQNAVDVTSNLTSPITSITWSTPDIQGPYIRAIDVDGVRLIDNSYTDTDVLFDVPTNGDSSNDTGAGGEVSGNYCTWSPLAGTNVTLSNGNLDCSLSAGTTSKARTTIAVTSGKYYWEITFKSGNYGMIGISDASLRGSQISYAAGALNYYVQTGTLYGDVGGSFSDTSYGSALSANDVLGIALDMDNGNVKFYKNGSDLGNANTTSLVGKTIMPHLGEAGGATFVTEANFGQRAFEYSAPSGYKALCTANLPTSTIADGSTAFDIVLYTSDSNSRTISGLNMSPDLVWSKRRSAAGRHVITDSVRGVNKELYPDRTAAERTSTDGLTQFNSDGYVIGDDDGEYGWQANGATFVNWAWDAASSDTSISAGSLNSIVYDTSQTWSSTGTTTNSSTIANAFDGSLTSYWAANANTTSRYTFASVYSGSKFELYIDVSLANTNFSVNGQSSSSVSGVISTPQWVDVTDAVTASNLGGLSYIEIGYVPAVHSQSIYAIRIDGKTLIDSNVTPANFPSIASTVRANQTAGFSIVSYTGTGANATVGHGIAAPSFIIVKDRDAGQDWAVWCADLPTPTTGFLSLNSTDVASNSAAYWNSTVPTSSVFSLGAAAAVNTSGNNYIAYCFAPVAGYSAIGQYTGNGNANGPMVTTSFRPAFILTKGIDDAEDWYIRDTARSPFNEVDESLRPNDTGSEYSGRKIDILSNGFKIRDSDSQINENGKSYLYYAVAENPFQANGGLAR